MNASLNPFEQGCDDARKDIAAGKARLFWGTRGAWGEFLVQLFRERFKVRVEHVDCLVWPGLVEYRDGYNATTIAHIDQTYGSGAFAQARAEVDRFRTESYARYQNGTS